MKLLPRQEINKAKAQERKLEIDSGLALARRVDSLREAQVTEEANLKKYRETAFAQVQYEIGQFVETKENLEKQCNEARELRSELLKPLDEEWLKIHIASQEIERNKLLVHKSKESLKEQTEKIKTTLSKVSDIATRTKQKEDEADKAKKEAVGLKDLAQHEYEKARSQTETQSIHIAEVNARLSEREKEYKVGIQTNELKARMLEEKESELITREQELARQMKLLELTKQVLYKNGNTSTTNVTSQ